MVAISLHQSLLWADTLCPVWLVLVQQLLSDCAVVLPPLCSVLSWGTGSMSNMGMLWMEVALFSVPDKQELICFVESPELTFSLISCNVKVIHLGVIISPEPILMF